MDTPQNRVRRRTVAAAAVTPLASILGSGLLIIVPVLERTLGAWSVFGAIGICAVAWVLGTVIRHNLVAVEARAAAHTLDLATARLDRLADAVIVVAYVISVALYVRIMAEYLVAFFVSGGSPAVEALVACTSIAVIVVIGMLRGFRGLDRLDRVALSAVLVLTAVLGSVLVASDAGALAGGGLVLPPVPDLPVAQIFMVLGGIVITVQGFETVRYLGADFDVATEFALPVSRRQLRRSSTSASSPSPPRSWVWVPPRGPTLPSSTSPPGSLRGSHSRW